MPWTLQQSYSSACQWEQQQQPQSEQCSRNQGSSLYNPYVVRNKRGKNRNGALVRTPTATTGSSTGVMGLCSDGGDAANYGLGMCPMGRTADH